MKSIPKAEQIKSSKIKLGEREKRGKENDLVVFSFEAIDKNEYFNLDGTCQNWAADLFDTMQKVSRISVSDINLGKYNNKHNPLRIHRHEKSSPPCKLPSNVNKEEMWQIRISVNKGGIHGVFSENIFYVIWFDPHHNLYPSKDKGGLKKITNPATTCCKERDEEINQLRSKNVELEKYVKELEACL